MTKSNNIFLQSYYNTFLYDIKTKKYYEHIHFIYAPDFFINRIKDSKHIYIDATFVVPQEFLQILILLFYDDKLCKRYPGAYMVMNNKKETFYITVLKYF